MELVGRPPVPPKKMFGLWVSEFGYKNWADLEDKLRTLRANHFPVDGFMMDLQWFGGVFRPPSQMGALTWDTTHFPDPAGNDRSPARRAGRRLDGDRGAVRGHVAARVRDARGARLPGAPVRRLRARDASPTFGARAACSTGPTTPPATTGTTASASR